MNDFINALFNTSEQKTVIAYFANGTSETYTYNILGMLKTEPDIQNIVDGETGEIIFTR